MNFATSIKRPTLVGVGLIDTVCPAEGVLATFSRIPAKKKLILMPYSGHGGPHDQYQKAFETFLEQHKN